MLPSEAEPLYGLRRSLASLELRNLPRQCVRLPAPGSVQSLWVPVSLARLRSNVPRGRCPAFRAIASTRQSENPNAGRSRKSSTAAATASGSKGQVLVIEQHIDRGRNVGRRPLVDRRQHPGRFSEHEMRHPRAALDKFFCCPTCLASSRVTRRTSTLVSTARTAPLHVLPHTGLQIREGSPFWRSGKEGPVDFCRREAAGTANDNLLPVIVPLQHRPGPDPELLSNLGGHGNLTLSGEFRVRESHAIYYHGNACAGFVSPPDVGTGRRSPRAAVVRSR